MSFNKKSISSRYAVGRAAIRKLYEEKQKNCILEIRRLRADRSAGIQTYKGYTNRQGIVDLTERYDELVREERGKLRKLDEQQREEASKRQSKNRWSF